MDDADLAIDPDIYDCQTCTVADALDGLDEDNRRAWSLYRRLARRLAADLHAGNEALRRLTAHVEDEDWPDLWDRLSALYDVLHPPEPKKD